MLPAGIVALGLVQGALAAIDALGFVLLYRTTRIVNLAQPSLGLVGGVLTGLLVTTAGWSFWWAAPVGIAVGALLGVATDRVVLRRLHDAPRAVVLVATVGVAQILTAVSAALPFMIAGRPVPTYPIDLGIRIELHPVVLFGTHLLALGALGIAWFGTHWFLHRSRFGLAALALGQESERARALGVPASAVRGIVWAVAGVLASLSGILSIPILGANLGGGASAVLLLLALTPAALARFRSVHVAVIGSLVLGVVYQAAIFTFERAAVADLTLAFVVVVVVAAGRLRLGRDEAATRASSWDAAATPRPLARAHAGARRVRLATVTALSIATVAAALLPSMLSPSGDVALVTSAAFTIAALGVAVAWMFAGEMSLGHWGFAGFGAVLAAVLPGPWYLRCVVATLVLAAAGAVLATVSRRRSILSFAVISLAAAATAPQAIVEVVGTTSAADPAVVGSVAALLVVVAATGALLLRRSRMGARMIAARDDPLRARWLGAEALVSRVWALSLSAGLAGLAGSLYFAGSTLGLTTQSFTADASLDLLSIAIIGGLGSPFGTVVAAIVIRAARIALPGTWGLLLSGAGVVIVVTFLPAGASHVLARVRDRAVATLTRAPREEVAA